LIEIKDYSWWVCYRRGYLYFWTAWDLKNSPCLRDNYFRLLFFFFHMDLNLPRMKDKEAVCILKDLALSQLVRHEGINELSNLSYGKDIEVVYTGQGSLQDRPGLLCEREVLRLKFVSRRRCPLAPNSR
jgi:hypothetical protein